MVDKPDTTNDGDVTLSEKTVLPVLPLRNMIVFPTQVIPAAVGREISLQAVSRAVDEDGRIALIAQRDSSEKEPTPEGLYDAGCVAEILKVVRLPDGTQHVILRGVSRFAVEAFTRTEPWIEAEIREFQEQVSGPRIDALAQTVRTTYEEMVELAPYLTDDHGVMAHNADPISRLADLVASTVQIEEEEKQALLAIEDVEARLDEALRVLNRELEFQRLSSKIQAEVEGTITKDQREYYLREQLHAIRKELGELPEGDELDDVRKRVAELPAEARTVAEGELRKLARLNPASPDYGVTRTYLDWLLDVPWTQTSEDDIDLLRARTILDRDHEGLEEAKERILEFLAVRKLATDMKGPILCFAGPPGVGKTSLGRSIAEALGRKYARISLGGVRDEAEIRGHRRTYIGSLPGRIVKALKNAGTMNPVIVLDEIDKLGRDVQGDPASALLEVLDPEQNSHFSDHYLEVPIDLSQVLFVTTANWLGSISAPLRDRMEVIEIPGYATAEKIRIADRHLLPRQITRHGLKRSQLGVHKAALERVIEDHTREAGVRGLDRALARIARRVARKVVEGEVERATIRPEDVPEYLGPAKFHHETAARTRDPGIAIGLAWTPVGGEVLYIESRIMPGRGRLTLTGKLGDVMKESAQAALSIVRSESATLGLEPGFLDRHDVHLHVPAGAVPKDGPSAGITILASLVSLLTGRPLKKGVCMTGEISLRGQVLPVGGIKEKVLAARRAGLRTVILSDRNRADVDELPTEVREAMRFVFVREVGQVLGHALSKRRSARPRPLLSGPRAE